MADLNRRPPPRWQRRARPLLGTLCEIGLPCDAPAAAVEHGFAAISAVQAAMSRFAPNSDLARFHRLPAGGSTRVQPATQRVLRAAQALHGASGGLFDISLGSGAADWSLAGGCLHRHGADVQLDLGGIAKGHALDDAVRALRAAGCASGWVNAGGDLRAFGAIELPLRLRDECGGGVRSVGTLADGALATSRFAPDSRAALHAPGRGAAPTHVSVAAPRGLWADALTKLVAACGHVHHPLLRRLGAEAWLH